MTYATAKEGTCATCGTWVRLVPSGGGWVVGDHYRSVPAGAVPFCPGTGGAPKRSRRSHR